MSSEKTHKASFSLEDKVTLFKRKFAAREDTFYEKTYKEEIVTNPDTGMPEKVMKRRIVHVCANYGDQGLCLIAQGKGKCVACSNKVNEHLTDAWIKKHIIGNKTLCLIPLTSEGTKLGAIDFDRSIQEGLEHVFADAKRVRDFCRTIGMESYIARSSNKGFHLYFFFSDWVPANKVTSFLLYALRETGFTSRMDTYGLPIPEIFPKQTMYGKDSIGNGLNVPLSESNVRNGKNCFVDDHSIALPLDKQWEYLAATHDILVEKFESVLTDNKVEIFADINASKGKKKNKIVKKEKIINEKGETVEIEVEYEEKQKQEQVGSFESIIASCPAMQEYWAKAPNGRYLWDLAGGAKGLFHQARYASMALALSTTDGEQTIKSRWSTPTTESMIEQAKREGYSPVSCRWMQQCQVCKVGKHPNHGNYCFKKLPPVHMENGKIIVNPDNLPEEDWPEPSPVRFRLDNKLSADEVKTRLDMVVRGIKKQKAIDAGTEVKIQKNEAGQPVFNKEDVAFTPERASEMLNSLMKRVAVMKASEREDVTSYVLAQKYFTKTDWNAKLKAVGAQLNEEKKKDTALKYKSFVFKGHSYFLKDGKILSMFTDAKGTTHEDEFANFWIERMSEPAQVQLKERNGKEEVVYENRTYVLQMHINGQTRAITMPNKAYSNSGPFFEMIKTAGGSDIRVSTSKEAYDVMMYAISAFSEAIEEKYSLTEIGYYDLKGGTKYIMPSVIVTKDEIEQNNTYLLEMRDEYVKNLDFQMIDPSQLKEISTHIIQDLFHANSSMAAMTAFAHAMSAVCIKVLEECPKNYKKSPVLWWWGGYGGGKTWLLEQMQYFYGDFSKAPTINARGSYKSKIAVCHHYRHAYMFYDDNKEALSKDSGNDMKSFVQSAYDRNIISAMKRDGDLREKPTRARGQVAITSEDPLSNESSAISRTISIDVDLAMDQEKGNRVLGKRHLYSGFTPYVIKHVLNLEKSTVAEMWDAAYAKIFQGSENAQDRSGAHRVSENLSMNYLGMQVAIDTMIGNGGISIIDAENILKQHMTNLRIIKTQMLHAVKKARGSQVFIDELKQLLADPTKYKIFGWPGTESEATSRAHVLGFLRSKDPGVVYLHPELAYQAVATAMRAKNSTPQSKPQIARQLAEDGYFVEELCNRKDRRYTVKRSDPSKIQQDVYPMKAEILGLIVDGQSDVLRVQFNNNSFSNDDFRLEQ